MASDLIDVVGGATLDIDALIVEAKRSLSRSGARLREATGAALRATDDLRANRGLHGGAHSGIEQRFVDGSLDAKRAARWREKIIGEAGRYGAHGRSHMQRVNEHDESPAATRS